MIIRYYLIEQKSKKIIFRGSLTLALAICRAFESHGINTILAVEKIKTEAERTEEKIKFLGEI